MQLGLTGAVPEKKCDACLVTTRVSPESQVLEPKRLFRVEGSGQQHG